MSIARRLHPFPFRTRSLRVSAAMVLYIRVWESSTMPGFFLSKFHNGYLKHNGNPPVDLRDCHFFFMRDRNLFSPPMDNQALSVNNRLSIFNFHNNILCFSLSCYFFKKNYFLWKFLLKRLSFSGGEKCSRHNFGKKYLLSRQELTWQSLKNHFPYLL